MDDFLITILTLLVVIELVNLLVNVFYSRRQTRAYEDASEKQNRIMFLRIKAERDKSREKSLPGGAYTWLATQVKEEFGFSVKFDEEDSITLETTPVLIARTPEGDSLIVSPLTKKTLRQRLQGLVKSGGRLANLTEESTVLDILKRARREHKRSLENAGEFFDIEAEKADDELGVGWGAADVLHMSWVIA